MKKNIFIFLIFIFTFTSLTFTNKMEDIVNSNNQTAINLLDLMVKSNNENVFLSPFSINSALSIALLGAKGETEREMLKCLNINTTQEVYHENFSKIVNLIENGGNKYCTIKNANRLWVQENQKFLKSFFENVEKFYKGGISKVDFENNLKESIDKINNWVSEKTENKIRNLLKMEDVDKFVKMIITNAIYFKGTWKIEFEEGNTAKKPFYLEDGKKVETDLMFNSDRYEYGENKDFQILKMNYKCDTFSMVIFLPTIKTPLNKTISVLRKENFKNFLKLLSPCKVHVYIPKFKFEKRYYMKKYLEELGMKIAFTYDADFSKMTGDKDLYIDKVIHQARIEVNERGSEAAAATAVVTKLAMAAPGFHEKVYEFKADHPFLFFIVNNSTGEIVFEGAFIKPE